MNWILLAIILVSAFIGFYFLMIRGAMRYKPVRWSLLLGGFAWGATGAILISLVLNTTLQMALAGLWDADPGSEQVIYATASFGAPLIEETAKGLGLFIIFVVSIRRRTHDIDGPLAGVILGGVIGLGFSLTEDIKYAAETGDELGGEMFTQVFIVRTLFLGLGHATYTAMLGLGFGLAALARSSAARVLLPLGGLAGAMALHFARNFLVSYLAPSGGGVAAIVLAWTTNLLFLVLVIVLAFRDRRIVRGQLATEVGRLLSPMEFAHLTSLKFMLPFWNTLQLNRCPAGYAPARGKQTALIELAFLRQQTNHGPGWSAGRFSPPTLRQFQGQPMVLPATATEIEYTARTGADDRIIITAVDPEPNESTRITITNIDLAPPPPRLDAAGPLQYRFAGQDADGQPIRFTAGDPREDRLLHEIEQANATGIQFA